MTDTHAELDAEWEDRNTSPTRRRPRRRRRPITLTDRDQQLLTFLTHYRYATVAQLARLWNGVHVRTEAEKTSPEALRKRIAALADNGMVDTWMPLQGLPQVALHTAAGATAVNESFPKPTLALGNVRHTILCSDVAISYMLLGHTTVSEREVMQIDYWDDRQPEDPLTYSPFHQPGRKFPHMPDMVVLPPTNPDRTPSPLVEARDENLADLYPYPPRTNSDGEMRPWAIEVELTAKKTSEIRRVLAGYAKADHLAGAIYLTPERSVARAVAAQAKAMQLLGDKILVHRLVPWQEV